eukprot:6198269-Pleurochrysis_carterae.AAC.3
MYTFIISDGTSAYKTSGTSEAKGSVVPAGAAKIESAGMQTALPSIVCGRENFHRTCSMCGNDRMPVGLCAVSKAGPDEGNASLVEDTFRCCV